MGKDANEEKERRPARKGRRPTAGIADWASANGATLIRAIIAAANCQGALRFGYSRDGGAYAIGVYGDGEPYTDFVAPTEDINETLEYYVNLFEDIADTPQTEKKSRGRA